MSCNYTPGSAQRKQAKMPTSQLLSLERGGLHSFPAATWRSSLSSIWISVMTAILHLGTLMGLGLPFHNYREPLRTKKMAWKSQRFEKQSEILARLTGNIHLPLLSNVKKSIQSRNTDRKWRNKKLCSEGIDKSPESNRFLFYFLITLLLFNYSCLHFPLTLPLHPSQSHLAPLLPPSPLILSICPL